MQSLHGGKHLERWHNMSNPPTTFSLNSREIDLWSGTTVVTIIQIKHKYKHKYKFKYDPQK